MRKARKLTGNTIFLGGRAGPRCSEPQTSSWLRSPPKASRSSKVPPANPRSWIFVNSLWLGAKLTESKSDTHGHRRFGVARRDHEAIPDRIE